MRQRLLILGASGFGREVASWASHVPPELREWDLAGFLDDRPGVLDGMNIPYGIVGAPGTYEPRPEDRVVVAIGIPSERRRYVDIVAARGARFTSIIHPSVVMGFNNRWGVGCIFCPGSMLTTNVTVGDHVVFNCHAGAGHDATIGSFTTLSGHADVTGYARLGEGVFLGSHASIAPGAEVGDGALVGAGSVVLKKVRPHTTVMGVPAREVWSRPTQS
jgi:sugar O-acyltransferase (sialic acid O-acetyltransferase NeuD family)